MGLPARDCFDWTPRRVARLKELATEGWSGQLIADEMGTSRSAVLGKAGRLKVSLSGQQRASAQHVRGVRASTDRSQRQQRSPKADTTGPRTKSPNRTMIVGRGPQGGEAPANTAIIAEALDPDRAPQQAKFIPLMDLDDKHCRWPLERDGKTLFCGCDPKVGSSYCATHHKRGHVPKPQETRGAHEVSGTENVR